MQGSEKRVQRSPRVWVTLIALSLGSLSLWAAEPEIACRQIVQQAITVTVMGADGSNPTVIFKGDKFKRGSTDPKWSPDGEWIAFRRVTNPEVDQVSGIYKIRPDGEEMTQILCAVGSAPGDVSFRSPYHPQWSPDGQWILVQLSRLEDETEAERWLGIVPASDVPDDNCYSHLIPLYTPEVDPETGEVWTIVAYAPTWTDDGSKIAFFEGAQVEGDEVYRLQVLDIDDSGEVPTVADEHPIDLPDGLQQVDTGASVDWQRGGGNILLTDIGDGVNWITWLELDPETYEIQDWGYLTEGWSATWSPQNDRMVYNADLELRVANIAYYPDGTPYVTDSSIIFPDQNARSCLWPDWKRYGQTVTCSETLPCDDDNPCTDDICNGGVCEFWPNTEPCDDGHPCTFPDACSGGLCLAGPALDQVDGSGYGCEGWCCAGDCWEGANSCEPPDCAPRGEPCLLNEECCSGQCHPIKATCK